MNRAEHERSQVGGGVGVRARNRNEKRLREQGENDMRLLVTESAVFRLIMPIIIEADAKRFLKIESICMLVTSIYIFVPVNRIEESIY